MLTALFELRFHRIHGSFRGFHYLLFWVLRVMSTEAPLLEPLESDAAAQGPICEKCEQPIHGESMAVCTSCGWYPNAGIFVEIDQQWEAANEGKPATQEPSLIDVWINLIPVWAWVVLGAGVFALAGSGAVRFLVEDQSLRTAWAVSQLFGGLAGVVVCHLLVFVVMTIDDPDLGIGDIVVSPFKAWKKLLSQMPARQWAPAMANFAVCAVIGSTLIIGGIPYEKMWDWGIRGPAKSNLLSAIADAAPQGKGEEQDMEEALGSFADDAAVGGSRNADFFNNEPKAEGPHKRRMTDALILGYIVDRNGLISEFMIATEVQGSLMYAGRVQPRFTPDESLQLVERLREAHSPRPIVTAPEGAKWVSPRFPCRVTYDKRVESGRLQGLLWEEMLGEVKLPW